MLISARDEDGQRLSDSEPEDQLLTLLLAGHETTAGTWHGASSASYAIRPCSIGFGRS